MRGENSEIREEKFWCFGLIWDIEGVDTIERDTLEKDERRKRWTSWLHGWAEIDKKRATLGQKEDKKTKYIPHCLYDSNALNCLE